MKKLNKSALSSKSFEYLARKLRCPSLLYEIKRHKRNQSLITLSRQKQCIVLAGPVFLQKRLVHPAPPPNGAAFLRQLQIGDVVVSYQSVADAVLMDFLW